MARPLRVEFEQAAYHVTARGNQRQVVFRDDADRTRFLETLAEAVGRFGVVVHAYCLMPNHHHLLLQTPRANLSRMKLWLRIGLAGESSSVVARELGYADSSGVHRVVTRLESKADTDAPLRKRLARLKSELMSNVRS